jgi:hypothetical protein
MTVGPRSPGTSLQAAVLNDGAWRAEERDAPSVPDPLIAARRRRSSRRLFPPNVRRSPNCGLWRQVQAERRAIAPPTGNARPKPP